VHQAHNCHYILVAQPGVTMEVWKNIPGNNIYQLKQNPRFPDKPDTSVVIRNMATPVNKMDNYGLRLTAYFKV
jgi:hypothetical protein